MLQNCSHSLSLSHWWPGKAVINSLWDKPGKLVNKWISYVHKEWEPLNLLLFLRL